MTTSRTARTALVAVLLATVLLGPSEPVTGQAEPPFPELAPSAPRQAPHILPERAHPEVDLASDDLRELVAEQGGSATPQGETAFAHVEIHHHTTAVAARRIVERNGGTVTGEVPGVLLEADVPVARLEAIEALPAVDFIQLPPRIDGEEAAPVVLADDAAPGEGLPGSGTVVGEEVAKTRADQWQAIGELGDGVQIGIIDNFSQAPWSAAQALGELPAPAGTFCLVEGFACSLFGGTSNHGVGVAEIIHDMAPEADLYIGTAKTASDLQALVEWFDGWGVDVISRSMTSVYDGPGDGTGPVDTVIDNAVAAGMTWIQSAANTAGGSGTNQRGSYYRWTYADADADDFVEFSPGNELLWMTCGFINGLRWSDFGSADPSDYDLYLYSPDLSTVDIFSSRAQGDYAPGVPPIETVPQCNQNGNFVAVWRYAENDGSAGDIFEFMGGNSLARWQNAGSASGPAADTGSTGALTVGAVDPPGGTAIAFYSSRGPTTDGRTKPDLSAAACVQSTVLSPSCFNGTSASTPAVAGGAALIAGAGMATSPQDMRTWILANAITDRGAPGTDFDHGAGEFILPSPFRPDGRIRAGNGALQGDDIYNGNATNQKVSRSGDRGANLSYTVSVQNDGFVPSRFQLRATAGTTRFPITYRVGGLAVTSRMTAGTYETAEIQPGAAVTVAVSVRIGGDVAHGGSFTASVTARPLADLTVRDVVKFTAQRS